MCCGDVAHVSDKLVGLLGVVAHSHDALDKPMGMNTANTDMYIAASLRDKCVARMWQNLKTPCRACSEDQPQLG